jgi:L-fucose isomerase-like protein
MCQYCYGGPKDEAPAADGSRLRDTQCGLFAIGKVLRRFNVPFTYLVNVDIDDPEFARGVEDFLKVCNIVKTFKQTRILQVGPRPFDFWSTMVNEGELLEKFNISLSPIPLPELVDEIHDLQDKKDPEISATVAHLREIAEVQIADKDLDMVAALKVALKRKNGPIRLQWPARFNAGQPCRMKLVFCPTLQNHYCKTKGCPSLAKPISMG